jgi:TolA-binding protein
MSDRRSFSEISAELLREHGADPRVDRIWRRLEQDVGASRSRHRKGPRFTLAVAALTFAAGVLVGARLVPREPLQLTALGAEPPSSPRPASAPPEQSALALRAAVDAPQSRQARHSGAARRVETVAPEPLSEEPIPAAPALTMPAEWQRLADEGEYARAFSALDAVGGFDAALHDASADQLMALVDVARATGQRDRAIVALRRIVSEHGADPNAPVAAWMLGSELAKARDLAAAEQAFAMYRALSPNGDFAEDALARQIDMAAGQGNLEHAKKLAGQYLKEFPNGPRSADIQARIEQWAAPSRAEGVSFVPDAGTMR